MRRALLAAFFIALPLRAALGAEIPMPLLPPEPAIPLSSGDFAPLPLHKPAVAALGDGFVAAWWDGSSERIQVIGADGRRATDLGVPVVSDLFTGAIFLPPIAASRGDSAAVAYEVSSTTYIHIVHADGTIDAAQGAPGGLPFLAANRDGYLLVLLTHDGASAVFLDPSGRTVGSRFAIESDITYFAAAASDGHDWLVMTRTSARVDTWIVKSTGLVSRGASFAAFAPLDLAATWDGSEYVVAWSDAGSARIAMIERDGTLRASAQSVASGNVAGLVSAGDGATLITNPPHFVRVARGIPVPIASGDLDLFDAGAAAQNGDSFLVAGTQRLYALITDLAAKTLPVTIAFAPRAQNFPRVATGGSLNVVSWIENSGGPYGTYTARLARVTAAGILDTFAIPGVGDLRIDASGYRIAIATIERGAVTLRAIDPQGNLWAPEVLVAPPTSPAGRSVAAVIVTPGGTAVVWTETAYVSTGLGSTTLYVSFERGPTFNLGTVDYGGPNANATWDGNAVVVAATAKGDVVVKAVAPDGLRWTQSLRLDAAEFLIAAASNRAGRTMIARSRDAAILDANGHLIRTVRLAAQSTGSAAFDGTDFMIAAFRHLLRVDVDGNPISSTDMPQLDSIFSLAVAPGAIAYSVDSRVYVRGN